MKPTTKLQGDKFTRTVAKRTPVYLWGQKALLATQVVAMLRAEHRAALRIVDSWVLGYDYMKTDFGRGYMSALNHVRDSLKGRAE